MDLKETFKASGQAMNTMAGNAGSESKLSDLLDRTRQLLEEITSKCSVGTLYHDDAPGMCGEISKLCRDFEKENLCSD
jgi:hypothetical protein